MGYWDRRVALVIGAGDGPGQAIALGLARRGAAVMAAHINPTLADATADAIQAAGGQALSYTVDIGNRFQVAAMIEQLRDAFGGLHLVVNAWWVNKRQPFLTLDEYDWRRVIEVNLTGAFLVGQLAGRVMVDEGGGAIVQLLPPVAPGAVQQAPYAASAAGLAALCAAMAAELEPLGVRVLAIPTLDSVDATVAAVLNALQQALE
ncbi:MAG: SDR family NAD(P)-dependent oxidoreductase [Anaerolineae bacterium]|nr:SDR family NAD(P)-dependent oxidoreductase [Anaerolineae bacterium]